MMRVKPAAVGTGSHTRLPSRAGTTGPGHTCHIGVFCASLAPSPFTGTWIPASCLRGDGQSSATWLSQPVQSQSLHGFTPRRQGPCEDPRGCPKAKAVGGSTAMGGTFQRLGLRHLSPSRDDGRGAAVVCVCGRGPKVCPRLNPAVASPFGEHLWLLVLIKASAKMLSVASLISPRLSKSCYRRQSPGC